MNIYKQDYFSFLVDILNLFTNDYYSGLRDTKVRDSHYTLNDFEQLFIFETSQELFNSVKNLYSLNSGK